MSVGKRTRPLPRRRRLERGGWIARKKRSADEANRIYGTPEHRAWMAAQPCWKCLRTPSQAAHVRNGGLSRKASWRLTVPLCGDSIRGEGCHTQFDRNKATWRAQWDMDAVAATYADRWLAYQGRRDG